MRILKKITKRRCVRRGIVYFLVYSVVLNTSLPAVLATPAGGLFTIGSGTITYGTNTAVTVDQTQSVIEWGAPGSGGINTSSAESLTFLQAGGLSNSAVLNRIMSGNPTQFDGTLSGLDMRIFVVNPAGIIFGEGSQINVSQLVASGLNMSNDAFNAILADESKLMVFREGQGTVQNLGSITAGSVYLIGKRVLNSGSILAPEGLVVMAAGDRVYLGQNGSSVLVEVGTVPADPAPDVVNEGSVTADNGTIILAAGDRFSRAISNVGTLAAAAGTITVDAARFENGGTINADGGGAISLTATEAIVLNQDGTTTADGGSLLVEAPELTIADGYIPADAAENTLYEKWVEEQSQAGTDLELVAGSKTLGNIVVENISDGEITGGNGDIALRTKYDTGGITFLSQVEGDPVTTTIHTTAGGSVYMLAGAGGITVGEIITEVPSNDKVTEPGRIRLFTNNYGNISTGQLIVQGGSYDEVSIIASGDLTIRGNVETITNQVPSEIKEVGQARTCLVSVHGDVDVEGSVIVNAHGKYYSTSDVHICAGANVTITLGPQQQIDASAHTSEEGPSDASVMIHAGKDIEGPGVIAINGGGSNPVHVYAKAGGGTGTAEVRSSDDPADWDETDGNAHAVLDIDEDRTAPCPDCPMPPDLPPPLPPITLPDMTSTHMNNSVNGNVLDNDSLPGGGNLRAVLTSEPSNGELTEFDWETGDYTYQPKEGFVGTDTFTYIATDGELYTDPITVTITVTNTLPNLADDTTGTHMGDPISGINVLANDADPDSDPFTVNSFSYEGSGTLVQNSDGTFTYTPPQGFVGQDSFTYTTSDGQTGVSSSPATAHINVTNALPVAGNDAATTHMDQPISDINVLANDADPDSDPFAVNSFSYEGSGTLVQNSDGTFTYTPPQGFTGQDSFTYTASDGQTGVSSSPATAYITVTNALPVAGPDTATTNQDVAVVINVLANDIDPDGDPFTAALLGSPSHGTLTANPDGTFTYTPAPGYAGEDGFTYYATDGQSGAEFAGTSVSITVNPVVVPPPPPPPPPTPVPVLPFVPAAPLPEPVELEYSGCPALMTWAASELGVDKRMMQIWVVNALASSREVQPCDACAQLQASAAVLRDSDGTYVAALAQVIGQIAPSSTAPPTPEQMTSIASAIANNTDPASQYATAGKYLDALAAYVGALNNGMNFSTQESITLTVDRYVAPLADGGNAGVAAFVAARLAAMGG
jgi:filamentous hemagglutinin family protein